MDRLLSPDTGLMIWTLVIFVTLLLVLARFAWKPLIGAIDERERSIKEAIEAANKTKNDVELLKKEYIEKVANNKELMKQMIEKAKEESEQLRTQMIAKSKEEAKDILKKAQESLNREKDKLLQELRQEAMSISLNATEKLLKQTIDKKIQEKFIHQFLDDLDKHSKEIH